MSLSESLAQRIPNKLKPPLRYLNYQFEGLIEHLTLRYSLRHWSKPVKTVTGFYLSHGNEIEAQLLPSFAAELLQATVDTDHLEGDIVELGTYKGGSTILIALVLDMIESTKHIYACDTYEGHPYDDIDSAVDHKRAGRGSDTSVSYVRSKFDKFGVSDRITIIKGKFEDTLLDKLGDKYFSLAFVDCDLYDSAKFCYSFLHPRIVHGWCIVVHDYAEPHRQRIFGISQATDEFLCEKDLVIQRKGSAHLIRIR